METAFELDGDTKSNLVKAMAQSIAWSDYWSGDARPVLDRSYICQFIGGWFDVLIEIEHSFIEGTLLRVRDLTDTLETRVIDALSAETELSADRCHAATSMAEILYPHMLQTELCRPNKYVQLRVELALTMSKLEAYGMWTFAASIVQDAFIERDIDDIEERYLAANQWLLATLNRMHASLNRPWPLSQGEDA